MLITIATQLTCAYFNSSDSIYHNEWWMDGFNNIKL